VHDQNRPAGSYIHVAHGKHAVYGRFLQTGTSRNLRTNIALCRPRLRDSLSPSETANIIYLWHGAQLADSPNKHSRRKYRGLTCLQRKPADSATTYSHNNLAITRRKLTVAEIRSYSYTSKVAVALDLRTQSQSSSSEAVYTQFRVAEPMQPGTCTMTSICAIPERIATSESLTSTNLMRFVNYFDTSIQAAHKNAIDDQCNVANSSCTNSAREDMLFLETDNPERRCVSTANQFQSTSVHENVKTEFEKPPANLRGVNVYKTLSARLDLI